MPWVLVFLLVLAGCVTGPTSTERMQADVGKPISLPIIRNGPPESIVRLSETRVAYTFLKKASGIVGGGISSTRIGGSTLISGDPIRSYNVECRFTLIVEAPRDGMPENEMIVVEYVPPPSRCD